MKIKDIDAYQIFDSRGQPTIEAVVTLENGVKGYGLVPSGASTGQFEALELRDGDSTYFAGKAVTKAIKHIKVDLANIVIGQNVNDQRLIDQSMCELDGTANKSRLGANAILGISLAVASAAAKNQNKPLYQTLDINCDNTLIPLPEIQLVGGGAHAQWRTDIQDFLLIVNGAKTYDECLEVTYNVYQAGQKLLKSRNLLVVVLTKEAFGQALILMMKYSSLLLKPLRKRTIFQVKMFRYH
ncbi:hypothetical protein [Colwellia maritima]|uniref:hypothetical protein n=1 Tax=Colwellia maritima TaxID=2912588 RepID=UPI00237A5E97|nr:hypothetical protein [Colwellia maritima]